MKISCRYINIFLLLVLVVHGSVSNAQKPIIVSKDGKGDFASIQAALNSLKDTSSSTRIIFIKKGEYNEKLFITTNNVSIIGEDVNKTIITYAEARDIFRCTAKDDWGVATINVKASDISFENLSVINSYGFNATGEVSISCPIESDSAIKKVRVNGHQMAFRSFDGATRMIFKNCVFRALGGDTVSPWSKDDGMFYFKNCVMEGGVDFYCPRGWALAEDCKFICHKSDAAIWHDGSAHQSSKTVLINCSFSGDDGFKLGRYHRDAQFYLLNCKFAKNMADIDIYQKEANPPNVIKWGKRVYYYNCSRDGGNFSWFANNLPDTLGYNEINPAWVFDYKWNPHKNVTSLALDSLIPAATTFTDDIAEAMLLYQRRNGGWPKHFKGDKVDYKRILSNEEKKDLARDYGSGIDATIDNEATTKEIKYLVKVFKTTNNKKYLQAAKHGIDYLLDAQYDNGGWSQFYPDHSSYRGHITYNDNAMVNVLNILQDIVEGKNSFDVFTKQYETKCKKAVVKAVSCILKTQIKYKKKLTAWCAQHDENTFEPAPARKFELVSISGSESVGITRFLMRMPNPTPKIIAAVKAAVEWFSMVKIEGYNYIIDDKKVNGMREHTLVKDSSSVIWARFYEIETNRPFFCGRDGVKKYDVSEIEAERRNGYAWYGTWPAKLLSKEYAEWKTKWNIQ